jgi:plasmid maintenance system antidote protein VapI
MIPLGLNSDSLAKKLNIPSILIKEILFGFADIDEKVANLFAQEFGTTAQSPKEL